MKCSNKGNKNNFEIFIVWGGMGIFLQQKRLWRNPGGVYYSSEKFGIRYPDGVEPSHTVVCYHKILFDADY